MFLKNSIMLTSSMTTAQLAVVADFMHTGLFRDAGECYDPVYFSGTVAQYCECRKLLDEVSAACPLEGSLLARCAAALRSVMGPI